MKQSKFIDETIRTADPTEAAVLSYDVNNRLTANSIASENLRKPAIIDELRERMIANGVNPDFLIKRHKANVAQTDNLPASNTALDMFYKILGAYAPEKKMSVNIDITADDKALQEQLDEIQATLAKLDDTSISSQENASHIAK